MSPTRIVPVAAAAFALLASVASISVARNVSAPPPPLAPKGVERSDLDFSAVARDLIARKISSGGERFLEPGQCMKVLTENHDAAKRHRW